ncbi:hypothetical protein BJF78_09225 [Pseudonocardia sp. CNS-139]|nr:hypothetical protein BJF78_09225 [Pseudonocardia sp. CNS-139]
MLRRPDIDADVRARATALAASAALDLAKASSDPAVARRAEAGFRSLLPTDEPAVWHNLAVTCLLQYERTGSGLADAIAASRRAVELGAPGEKQDERIAVLAQTLGRDGRFDEGLTLVRDALAAHAGEQPAVLLDALGNVLHQHHDRFGGAGELDESITALRSAARAGGPTTARLSTLATALRARYAATGDLGGVREAIAANRRALAALPDGHADATRIRANLVVQLTALHGGTDDEEPLDEAIDIGRVVVAATAAGHPALPTRLANLAHALGLRHAHQRDRAVMDEAFALERRAVLDEVIAVGRRAVELAPPGHPELPLLQSNLASALNLLAATGERGAVREAVRMARRALAATPEDHPARARRLIVQANAYATAGLPTQRRTRRVADAYRAAARMPAAPPSLRLAACKAWGEAVAGLHEDDETATAYAEAVRLLPRVAGRNLSRVDAEYQLAHLDGVHLDAAAWALRVGDPEGALTLLEQGRGVLLSYALDTRTELTDLRAAAPGLAAEVDGLTHLLDAKDDRPAADPNPDADLDSVLDRHALVREWDATMARVRALPGFAGFGAPPPVEDLLPSTDDGAVVVVNVSDLRCDALVVTAAGVRAVRLPGLTSTMLWHMAGAFTTATDFMNAVDDLPVRMHTQGMVRMVLGWLWDAVAEPVLDALGHTEAHADGAPWPRIWWSPTGLLNFLPLHAAGHHDQPGRSVIDRVVSSYTPTLRALQHARSRPAVPDPALLTVRMAETPDLPPLPAAVAEAAGLGDARTVRLTDAGAGRDAVLAALARCGWAHFACHAVSDPQQPSESHLVLHDGPLAVRDVGRLRLRDAELAFLAACSTARGAERLADESIHIASAFQLAGYRHVVGTLWPAGDATAARLANDFYQRLHAGDGPAAALHLAVREVRAEQPLTPSAWACYMHAGP